VRWHHRAAVERGDGTTPSPQQAVVLNITDRSAAYAGRVVGALKAAGFRVFADLRNEKITYKIREHSLQKLPYQLIVGDKEQQAETVAVRTRGGEDLGAMSLEALLERLRKEVAARS
jgi:threonyl-tRNA synthetase